MISGQIASRAVGSEKMHIGNAGRTTALFEHSVKYGWWK